MSRLLRILGGCCAYRFKSFYGAAASKMRRSQSKLASVRRFERLEERLALSSVPFYDALFDNHIVFSSDKTLSFSGETTDSVEVAHSKPLSQDEGTIGFSFTSASATSRQALFSKDHTGYQEGGHVTVSVAEGRIEARLQSDSTTVTLRSAVDSIVTGQEHQVAVGFGSDGFRLYVDGQIADAKLDFTQGIAENDKRPGV